MSLRVLRPAALATVQDLGRPGRQHLGIVPGGAMDPVSHRIANALVGNRDDAATLEIALSGPELLFTRDALCALYGARFTATVGAAALPMARPVHVRAGTPVRIGRAKDGCFAYLAVAGGLDVPMVLGSRSTYLPGGFGGWRGRALERDAALPLADDVEALSEERFARASRRHGTTGAGPKAARTVTWFAPALTLSEHDAAVIRVIDGLHRDLFDEGSRKASLGDVWRVASDSNRIGFRLLGPKLVLVEPTEILTQPTCRGTVQVPPGGQPIALMADHQTTGGYPKMAEVISADVPRLAQRPPGTSLHFAAATLDEADAAREALGGQVAGLVERILWEFDDEGD
jgi:antagonist of KipI